MKERPILFSKPMVRALLAGTKTQTRRVVKGFPLELLQAGNFTQGYVAFAENGNCPYGFAGDRLWVRETFKPIASGQVKEGYGKVRYGYAYAADGATTWAKHETEIFDLTGQPSTGPMQFQDRAWKPSIHMPRRASRITLEITDVRVQRLQDISEADAMAEGAHPVLVPPDGGSCPHVEGFRELWESINGAGSWDANPWVWAITFKRSPP